MLFRSGVCAAAGALNPSNVCQGCQPGLSTSSWTDLIEWYPCSDDGEAYTLDICDGSGACVHQPTGFCVIGDTNYAGGTPNPQNECEECNPTVTPDAWTARLNGYPCTDDGLAYTQDVCDGFGECTHVNMNVCVIGGTTYAGGAANPQNSCEECNPAVDQDAWSSRMVGYPCSDDGLEYTLDVCDGAGVCQHLEKGVCVIEGETYFGGTTNPANECEECKPSVLKVGWSSKTEGVPCADDGNECTYDICNGSGSCQHPVKNTQDCMETDGDSEGDIDEIDAIDEEVDGDLDTDLDKEFWPEEEISENDEVIPVDGDESSGEIDSPETCGDNDFDCPTCPVGTGGGGGCQSTDGGFGLLFVAFAALMVLRRKKTLALDR
mgnify:CR=1 FL=1